VVELTGNMNYTGLLVAKRIVSTSRRFITGLTPLAASSQ